MTYAHGVETGPSEDRRSEATTDISSAVIANGLDFMESAVEHLAEGSERDLRYAALHLSTAIETILKVRLSREHWTLVVADVDKADRASYEIGDFQSVTISQALKRLKEVAGSSCNDQEARRIGAVAKLRNRVAHFALHGDNPQATKATVARGLDVLLHFISREMLPGSGTSESVAVDEALERIQNQLGKIEVLVRDRMQSLRPALDEAPIPLLTCPGCGQGAYVLGDGEPGHCLYCFYHRDGEVAAVDYVATALGESRYEAVKGRGGWSIHPCIECGLETFVDGVIPVVLAENASAANPGNDILWACFACGLSCTSVDINECARCGEIMYAASDGATVCASCTAAYLERD